MIILLLNDLNSAHFQTLSAGGHSIVHTKSECSRVRELERVQTPPTFISPLT